MRRYDVVVVGGGPAGAMAAHSLARRGARVALLERATLPREKTCGGGLVGRALGRLPPLTGWRPERQLPRAALHWAGTTCEPALAESELALAMTMRADFDLALVEAAVAAGAALHQHCAFLDFRRVRGRLVVETEDGPLGTGLLVGADGAGSRVARAAGWPPATGAVPALEAELVVDAATLERFSGGARFDLGLPSQGYAWVFPKRAHLSVGVLSMRRGHAPLKSLLAGYLRALGIPTPRVERRRGATIPLAPRRGGAVRPGVVLLGDAAGLADPVTAEGISYALASGALLGAAFAEAGGAQGAVERAYAQRLASAILPELRRGRALARALYRWPRLSHALLRRRGDLLCRIFCDVASGRRSYAALMSHPWHGVRTLLRPSAEGA